MECPNPFRSDDVVSLVPLCKVGFSLLFFFLGGGSLSRACAMFQGVSLQM